MDVLKLISLLGCVLLPNFGGVLGALYMQDSLKNWYQRLKKPNFCPPDWVFGPVWTFLYVSIGAASYLVYTKGNGFEGPARLPLMAYGANLLINWAWSPIFFNLKKLDLAFYEILLLDASTIATGILFYQINKTAGYLFVPYTIWLTLATAISYRVWRDNPKQLKD